MVLPSMDNIVKHGGQLVPIPDPKLTPALVNMYAGLSLGMRLVDNLLDGSSVTVVVHNIEVGHSTETLQSNTSVLL